jgi:hypothetical protein
MLPKPINWYLENERKGTHAVRKYKGKLIYMEDEIMGIEGGKGKIVIHLNGNTLDNQRHNLRVVDLTEGDS